MNYVSTKTIESKTQGGARFVLRRMNDRRRQALDQAQAAATAKLKPLFEELTPLDREYAEAWKKAKALNAAERAVEIKAGATEAVALERYPYGKVAFSDEKFARWSVLRKQIDDIEKQDMVPAVLRYVVVRLEEYEIDGEAADLEKLLADGPDEFREEILLEVKRELGLLREEQENLSSPSTSGAVEGGKSPSGSAIAAETSVKTTVAAAGSTTDPTP